MGIAAILFSSAKVFDQIVSTTSREDPMWNLMKIDKWFHRRHLKIYTILYMYKVQGQG